MKPAVDHPKLHQNIKGNYFPVSGENPLSEAWYTKCFIEMRTTEVPSRSRKSLNAKVVSEFRWSFEISNGNQADYTFVHAFDDGAMNSDQESFLVLIICLIGRKNVVTIRFSLEAKSLPISPIKFPLESTTYLC